MRRLRTKPVPCRSALRMLVVLVVFVVLLVQASWLGFEPALPTVAHAETPGTTPAVEPAPRAGLRVRFAAIDGQTGLEGNAFLLFSSRRVSLDTPASACGGSHVVRAEARGSRGLLRKVELTLHVLGGGAVPVQAAGCPRAELRAELEDGTVLSSGDGTVTLQTAELRSGGAVSGTYSWTATRGGAPFPMRGEFHLTLP